MADDQVCLECGRPLDPAAPAGACLACLLRRGLDPASDPPDLDGTDAFDVTYGIEPTDVGHVIETLSRSIGPIPRVLLPDTAQDDLGMPVVKPSSPEMPSPTGRGERYQLFGEIARGGMGAVLKGRDADLGRDLAVKVLLEGLQDKPDLIRRFVEEAQIGGQLQHPGIVPVYELGTFADRRPYFTMKLVKGRTLAALLQERTNDLLPGGEGARRADEGAHRDSTARTSPWSAGLPRFLTIFEAVCQTVAYAHARGVIHRDLKPSNVMVGSFGEVQVMDWGLAKVLKEGGVHDEPPAGPRPDASVIATVRSGSDVDVSEPGSVMGTPAYMAPEQAGGQLDRVDRRSDVFGLGSILCEILTGRPAFTGGSQLEVIRKAMNGNLAEALAVLDSCGAEAELVSLARDCLAAEPQDRPRDAGVVAGRITAYLAGVQERLRTAERERAVAEARTAEERERRKWQLGLAAAVLALVALGGAGASVLARQRAETRGQLALLLDRADTALSRAEAASDPTAAAPEEERARLALDQAAPLIAQLSDQAAAVRLRSLRGRSGRAAAFRELVDRLETIRGEHADHWDEERTDRAYAQAFRAFGLEPDAHDGRTFGAALAGRPVSVDIGAALDDWALARRKGMPSLEGLDVKGRYWMAVAARVADPDAWRTRLRSILHRYVYEAEGLSFEVDDQVLRRLADDVGSLRSQPATSLVLLSRYLEGTGDRGRAVAVLRAAWRWWPGDFWVNLNLGLSSWDRNRNRLERPDEAIPYLRAAVAVRPRSPFARINLAAALAAGGQFDEAAASCREAIRLRPDDAAPRENLGFALRAQGDLPGAVAAYREAIRLKPDDAEVRITLGDVLRQQGQYAESLAEVRIGHELGSKRADWRHPSAEWVAEAERLATLADRLPAVLKGTAKPADNAERLAFAQMLYDTKRYAASARLWAEALESDPKLAEDRQAQHRYNASCAAALAAAGAGDDSPRLHAAAKAELRRRALGWLKGEMAEWSRHLESAGLPARPTVVMTLQHWKEDADLAGIRDPDALGKLPADEQKAWRALWADVENLLKRARS